VTAGGHDGGTTLKLVEEELASAGSAADKSSQARKSDEALNDQYFKFKVAGRIRTRIAQMSLVRLLVFAFLHC
jgi:hypothetical protein